MGNRENKPQWLTTEELAAELRCDVRTIYGLREAGQAPTAYRIGKRLIFRREDVEAWLETRRAA